MIVMEENSLRLVLIILGVLVVVGIYLYDVIKKKNQQKTDEKVFSHNQDKILPTFSSETAIISTDESGNWQGKPHAEGAEVADQVQRPDIPTAEPALVIKLVVLPTAGSSIEGLDLLNAFTDLNLEFGDMGIFHRYERQGGSEAQLFHVANLMEPGTFPVGSMGQFESTGVVLFFQANSLIDSNAAFDSMLITARELSQVFGATLACGDMQELTLDKIEAIQSQLQAQSGL
ncbi:MAG: cell division protein ZipA [Cycloclasticus sp.]|nr:MAG: cell division protein ZipA [Cycloclasticus sp.]